MAGNIDVPVLFILNGGRKALEEAKNYFWMNILYNIFDLIGQGYCKRLVAVRNTACSLRFFGILMIQQRKS